MSNLKEGFYNESYIANFSSLSHTKILKWF